MQLPMWLELLNFTTTKKMLMSFKFRSSILLVLLTLFLFSCGENGEFSSVDPVNWEKRKASLPLRDSLETGSSYLSVYSQIYSQTEHLTYNLTVTVSIRNVSVSDSVNLTHADYYDTHGELIRSYFEDPIYLIPLETVEIVIDEKDIAGGTGGNFIFGWKTGFDAPEPHFEAVMISTSGQQGLSFNTQGIRID